MTLNELVVTSEEQKISLLNGYAAFIKFDPFYKRWYYDLYQGEQLKFAGVALNVNTLPLVTFTNYSLGLIDKQNKNTFYEPYLELGGRLGLLEVSK